jgi:hypothetical protein
VRDHLSHTALGTFLACQQRFAFHYEQQLTPAIAAEPLALGRAFAHALEVISPEAGETYLREQAAQEQERAAGNPWLTAPSADEVDIQATVVREASRAYINCYGTHAQTREVELRARVRNPAVGGRYSLTHDVMCRVDAVATDWRTLFEDKLVGQIPRKSLGARLALDRQVSIQTYLIWRTTGVEVDEVRYRMTLKPAIRASRTSRTRTTSPGSARSTRPAPTTTCTRRSPTAPATTSCGSSRSCGSGPSRSAVPAAPASGRATPPPATTTAAAVPRPVRPRARAPSTSLLRESDPRRPHDRPVARQTPDAKTLGITPMNARVFLAGMPKVGKTTLAASWAPKTDADRRHPARHRPARRRALRVARLRLAAVRRDGRRCSRAATRSRRSCSTSSTTVELLRLRPRRQGRSLATATDDYGRAAKNAEGAFRDVVGSLLASDLGVWFLTHTKTIEDNGVTRYVPKLDGKVLTYVQGATQFVFLAERSATSGCCTPQPSAKFEAGRRVPLPEPMALDARELYKAMAAGLLATATGGGDDGLRGHLGGREHRRQQRRRAAGRHARRRAGRRRRVHVEAGQRRRASSSSRPSTSSTSGR